MRCIGPSGNTLDTSWAALSRDQLDYAGFRILRAAVHQPSIGNTQGGCALIVKKCFPGISISSYSASDGQAISCQLGKIFVTSVWQCPSTVDCTEWVERLHTVRHANSELDPLVFFKNQ